MLSLNIFTCKGTYMTAWFGQCMYMYVCAYYVCMYVWMSSRELRVASWHSMVISVCVYVYVYVCVCLICIYVYMNELARTARRVAALYGDLCLCTYICIRICAYVYVYCVCVCICTLCV